MEFVKNVAWYELEPNVFTETPAVLDELGLKDLGEKMTQEHNRMIRKKHDIRRMLEGSVDIPGESGSNPFDFEHVNIDMTSEKYKKLEGALELSALHDPEYRACAKEFLTALLPVVLRKQEAMEKELNEKILEYEAMEAGYKRQIAELKQRKHSFTSQVYAVLQRFVYTDRGSATNGGHMPCENPEIIFHLGSVDHPGEFGVRILQMIDQMDNPKPDDIEKRLDIIKSRWKPNVTDGNHSVPYGGAIEDGKVYGDGNGLMEVIRNIFR